MSESVLGATLAAGAAGIELGPGDVVLMGLTAATAAAVLHASHGADARLSDRGGAEVCIECGEIPCFPGGKGPEERAETQRELEEQQDFINSLSPEEMDQRLAEAEKRKSETKSYRPKNDAQHRAETRDEYYQRVERNIRRRKIQDGVDPEIAAHDADMEARQQMSSLDAAHILDSIVGGNESDADRMQMRPRSANRRVGSAWNKKRRREALKNAVKKALTAGMKKLDIHMRVCGEEEQ